MNVEMAADRSPVRVLTIEQANALVPELGRRVADLLVRSGRVHGLVGELQSRAPTASADASGQVVDVTMRPGDSSEIRRLKRDIAEGVRDIRSGWSEVEGLGAVVKDPRIGLVDFYGRVDGRLVCLCWKHPETSIEHYHELDAGLAGRKPLADVRARLLN